MNYQDSNTLTAVKYFKNNYEIYAFYNKNNPKNKLKLKKKVKLNLLSDKDILNKIKKILLSLWESFVFLIKTISHLSRCFCTKQYFILYRMINYFITDCFDLTCLHKRFTKSIRKKYSSKGIMYSAKYSLCFLPFQIKRSS